MLWQKLRLCALHFDFDDETEAARRDLKRTVLLELIEAIDAFP